MPDERLVATANLIEITVKLATLVKHDDIDVSLCQPLQGLRRYKPLALNDNFVKVALTGRQLYSVLLARSDVDAVSENESCVLYF